MSGNVFALPLSNPRPDGRAVVFSLPPDGPAFVRFAPRHLAIEAAGPKLVPRSDGTPAFDGPLHPARTMWRGALPERAPFTAPAAAFATDPVGTAEALRDVWRWHAEHTGRVLCEVGTADDLTALLTGLADIHGVAPTNLAVLAAAAPGGTGIAQIDGRWAGRADVERLLAAALPIMRPAGFTAERGSIDSGCDFRAEGIRVRAERVARSAHRRMCSRANVLRVTDLLAEAADAAAPGSSVALRRAARAVLKL